MPVKEAMNQSSLTCIEARGSPGLDLPLIAMMLYALARGSEALAADPASADQEFGMQTPAPAPSSDILHEVAPAAATQSFMMLSAWPEPVHEFSATEFCPRKRSPLDGITHADSSADDLLTLRSTTVWQRMTDYRAQHRVRLVTLWESGDSTLSLQAGKHGEPSIQWSSNAMNRGGATSGLLDRVISASLGAAGMSQQRGMSRPASSSSPPKQINLRPTAASNAP